MLNREGPMQIGEGKIVKLGLKRITQGVWLLSVVAEWRDDSPLPGRVRTRERTIQWEWMSLTGAAGLLRVLVVHTEYDYMRGVVRAKGEVYTQGRLAESTELRILTDLVDEGAVEVELEERKQKPELFETKTKEECDA